MRLQIENLEDTFDHLRNMNKLRYSDDEYAIEKDQTRTERLKRLCNLSYNQAFLFEPFDFAQLFFRITGNYYSSTFLLYPSERRIYRGLGMTDFFKNNIGKGEFNYDFVENSIHGTGYVMKEKKAAFVIGECSKKDDRRLIAMGTHGTIPKLFPENKDEFDSQMMDLQTIINIYIKSYYEAAERSGINDYKPAPDIIISLTP